MTYIRKSGRGNIQLLQCQSNSDVAGATTYIGIGGVDTRDTTDFPSLFGRSGILRNLKVSQTAASGVGEQYVYTVRITGVDTSITCTIAGAADTTGEDVTHTEVVNSGDHVSIKIVSSGGAGANRPRISLDFEPD